MGSSVLDKDIIKRIAELSVIGLAIKENKGFYVPVAVSNRHVHLSARDLELLFGKGYKLTKKRDLIQPGQYASEELVTLQGPKGSIQRIRVLGPVRAETQVEISMTDTYKVGIKGVIRMSGDLNGTPGCKLIGPAGEVTLSKGVIVSARHLHMSADEAAMFGLKTGDVVSVKKGGERSLVMGNVIVRAGEGHSLEMHIDTDEANAAGMTCGELLELIK